MIKKLTATTSLLLLGVSGVAMAQETPAPTLPPLVVSSVQATADVAVDSIAVGGPCVDAVQALRAVPLELQGTNVIGGSFLTFVMGTDDFSGTNAILLCAPEMPAIAIPPPPPPQ